MYGGLNDAILALLLCLATSTDSDLIDYFSDLLATSSEFINPELRNATAGIAGSNKRATLNNYLLEVNYARRVTEINDGRTAESKRLLAEQKKEDA